MMDGNVRPLDRFFRAVVGLGLLYMPLVIHEPWAWVGLIGLLPLASAMTGYCPAYSMMCCKKCCCGEKSCPVCGDKTCSDKDKTCSMGSDKGPDSRVM
ncbi:MAG: DUF2892 domain-containing protein [Pseudomonadota bacterium]|nr:DUF2892 domain-containing protein [Pseudomonadota bacterium]